MIFQEFQRRFERTRSVLDTAAFGAAGLSGWEATTRSSKHLVWEDEEVREDMMIRTVPRRTTSVSFLFYIPQSACWHFREPVQTKQNFFFGGWNIIIRTYRKRHNTLKKFSLLFFRFYMSKVWGYKRAALSEAWKGAVRNWRLGHLAGASHLVLRGRNGHPDTRL